MWTNNIAHSSQYGTWLSNFKEHKCAKFDGGFKAYKILGEGFFIHSSGI